MSGKGENSEVGQQPPIKDSPQAQYLFGDTDLAAHRLEVLADIFCESSRPFLQEVEMNRPELAIDLGCGPGFTTRLLADTLKPERTLGLDNSEHFVSLASKDNPEDISFLTHDITSVPFPEAPADLLYCRLLLTHLPDAMAIIDKWGMQLKPGGLLLMEEVDWIRTDHPVFSFYLSIVEAMLLDKSGELYIGPLLNEMMDTERLRRRESSVRRLPVLTHRAAGMFHLNIQSWKQQPFIQDNYSVSTIENLQKDLCELSNNRSDPVEIEWGMRQIVLERV